MRPVLLLAHRIPYPPNKGDKIRSYHLLRMLAERASVYLGAFVDDRRDWAYADTISGFCEDVLLLPLARKRAVARTVRALYSGMPMTVPYYHDARMRDWVYRTIGEKDIETAVVFSSGMAQYLDGPEYGSVTRLMDFVDVDSEKWLACSRTGGALNRWLYGREARRLLEYERRIAGCFDSSWFVSPEEADLFKRLAPEAADKTYCYRNGVDAIYFSPEREYTNPYGVNELPLVFTGAMDYGPNIEAVSWVCKDVFPEIRKAEPRAVFYIVGSNPPPRVRSLGAAHGVHVTGWVDDTRPYLAHAVCALAPLRLARGVQNKVLEALAMACPVVATSAAAAGIPLVAGRDIAVADTEPEIIDAVLGIVGGRESKDMGWRGRRIVVEQFSWQSCLEPLAETLFGATALVEGAGEERSRNTADHH